MRFCPRKGLTDREENFSAGSGDVGININRKWQQGVDEIEKTSREGFKREKNWVGDGQEEEFWNAWRSSGRSGAPDWLGSSL